MQEKYMLILTDTFEEVEAITQVDFLRRATILIDMISITGTCLLYTSPSPRD